MSRHNYTAAELAIIEREYPNAKTAELAERLGVPLRSLYQLATRKGWRKSKEFLQVYGGRTVGKTGMASRFQPGQTPHNKGRRQPGWAAGRMRETQFKPGSRSGRAEELHQPIGAERIRDGYLVRKINDNMPLHKRWRAVHLLIWEEQHGPLPPGHAVAFLPGRFTTNAADITTDGLELITRKELMRRNTICRFPPEVRELIHLQAKLKRTIQRHEEQAD